MDSKNFLVSKTLQGIVVMLLAYFLPKLGVTLGDAEMQNFAQTILVILGGAWSAYGRATASKSLAAGKGKQAGHGNPLLFLFLALAVLLGGCAAKNIAKMSGPDAARSVAYELLQAYRDLHASYLDTLPKLSPERQALARRDMAPKMDQARRVLLALASAANAWSIAVAEDNDLAKAKFQALWAEAANILHQAQTLYANLTREE